MEEVLAVTECSLDDTELVLTLDDNVVSAELVFPKEVAMVDEGTFTVVIV